MVIKALSAIVAVSISLVASAAGPDLKADIQRASGVTKPGTWVLKGTCVIHGMKENLELLVDGTGRSRLGAYGVLPSTSAFDGKIFWEQNWSGMPHVDTGAATQSEAVAAAVVAGSWLSPSFVVRTGSAGKMSFTVQPKGARFEATVEVDEKTLLPATLRYWTATGGEVWTFSKYRNFSGRTFPTSISRKSGDELSPYTFSSAEPARSDMSAFSMPKPTGVTSNDPGLPSSVEVKFAAKHIFVRPTINGIQGGWFFLDTGAEVMCIDTAVAQRMGLELLGHETTAGVVGSLETPIFRAKSFGLGSVSYKDPVFIAFDLAPIGKAVGFDVVGICGYDFLARAVLDIDPAAGTLNVLPAGSDVPIANWTPFSFIGRVPALRCLFEGESQGLFHLDTGSDTTVDFCSPLVNRLRMLDGRKTSNSVTAGAGGNASAPIGNIAYFEMAGHRFEEPRATFQTTAKGAYSNPFMDGNIGNSFLGHFRMVLDYSRLRLGFSFEK